MEIPFYFVFRRFWRVRSNGADNNETEKKAGAIKKPEGAATSHHGDSAQD